MNPSLAKSISVPEVPYGLLVSLRYLKIRGFGWRAWSTLARRSPKELLRQWLVPQARLNVDTQLVQTTLMNLQKAAKNPPDLLSLALRVALQWDCGEEVEWCRERAVRDTQTPMTLYWLAQYAREFKRIPGMPSEFWEHVHSQASETHHWQICAEKSTQTGLHLSYLLAAYWTVRFRTGLEAPFYRRRLGDILDRQAILIPQLVTVVQILAKSAQRREVWPILAERLLPYLCQLPDHLKAPGPLLNLTHALAAGPEGRNSELGQRLGESLRELPLSWADQVYLSYSLRLMGVDEALPWSKATLPQDGRWAPLLVARILEVYSDWPSDLPELQAQMLAWPQPDDRPAVQGLATLLMVWANGGRDLSPFRTLLSGGLMCQQLEDWGTLWCAWPLNSDEHVSEESSQRQALMRLFWEPPLSLPQSPPQMAPDEGPPIYEKPLPDFWTLFWEQHWELIQKDTSFSHQLLELGSSRQWASWDSTTMSVGVQWWARLKAPFWPDALCQLSERSLSSSQGLNGLEALVAGALYDPIVCDSLLTALVGGLDELSASQLGRLSLALAQVSPVLAKDQSPTFVEDTLWEIGLRLDEVNWRPLGKPLQMYCQALALAGILPAPQRLLSWLEILVEAPPDPSLREFFLFLITQQRLPVNPLYRGWLQKLLVTHESGPSVEFPLTPRPIGFFVGEAQVWVASCWALGDQLVGLEDQTDFWQHPDGSTMSLKAEARLSTHLISAFLGEISWSQVCQVFEVEEVTPWSRGPVVWMAASSIPVDFW